MFVKLSNKDETKYSDQKALSPSLLICCFRKKRFQESLCSCQVGLLSVKFKFASCGSLIFICFALNSVEAREGMLFLLFLDKNRGNILSDIKFSCMVNVFLFQVKAYRCGAFFSSFFTGVRNAGEPSIFA